MTDNAHAPVPQASPAGQPHTEHREGSEPRKEREDSHLTELRVLVEACVEAYGVLGDWDDEEDVSLPPTGITFGQVRRARASLARISSQFEESANRVAGLSADVTRLEADNLSRHRACRVAEVAARCVGGDEMSERSAMEQLQSLLGIWLTDSPGWPPAPGIEKALRLLRQVEREHIESLAVYIEQIKSLTRDNEHAYNAYRELTEGRP